MERKVTRGWIKRDGARGRGGAGGIKESPKARTRKLKVNPFSLTFLKFVVILFLSPCSGL